MKKKIFTIGALALAIVSFAQTGNVGIATSTPTERLDIGTGNLRVRDISTTAGSQTDRFVVADITGVLKTIPPPSGHIQFIGEVYGTTPQTIAQNVTADLNGASITFTTTNVTTAMITYSALPLPANGGAPVQGSIDLVVDGVKVVSSYYSAGDSGPLIKTGNYSTAQHLINNLPVGTHTIKLQAKSWVNSTNFNIDPVASGYGGALPSDSRAFKARISVIVLN